MSLELRLLDEPDARAVMAGQCPEGFDCPPDFPADSDRVAAGLFLERCAADADPRPYGAFLICLVPDEAGSEPDPESAALIVGGIGFHGPPDDDGRVEIGYGIVPSRRRNGYATQALVLLIDQANALGAKVLTAETELENHPSQAVLERAGFSRYATDERAAWFELPLSHV